MIVLGLDTTGAACSVSIVDDATVLAHVAEDIGRGHAERLAGMVEEALGAASLTPQDIDRIAVCTGPGNFTGLRVALSFAKGFALPRRLPIIGIDALALTAARLDPDTFRRMAIRCDIRRNQFFYALYASGKPQEPPRAMSEDELRQCAVKEGVDEIHEAQVDTRILAWLAIERDPETHPAEPLYSRAPDAKLPGGKAVKANPP